MTLEEIIGPLSKTARRARRLAQSSTKGERAETFLLCAESIDKAIEIVKRDVAPLLGKAHMYWLGQRPVSPPPAGKEDAQVSPEHDEKFRMMLERLIGYCTMHGRDMHKNPDAWGETIRSAHGELVRYVESRMAPAPPASGTRESEGDGALSACRSATATWTTRTTAGTLTAPATTTAIRWT